MNILVVNGRHSVGASMEHQGEEVVAVIVVAVVVVVVGGGGGVVVVVIVVVVVVVATGNVLVYQLEGQRRRKKGLPFPAPAPPS